MTTLVISRFVDEVETVVGTLQFDSSDELQLSTTGPRGSDIDGGRAPRPTSRPQFGRSTRCSQSSLNSTCLIAYRRNVHVT